MTAVTDAVSWRWGDIDAYGEGDDVELRHRHAHARLRLRNGRLVRGKGYAEADRGARQQLARVGAILRLRQRGRYLLHATGAVDPQGRAWLLAGDSGCGKSTLGYALHRAGWATLGDDGVVIGGSATGSRAFGWREPLRVSRMLAGHFPELDASRAPVPPNDARHRLSLEVPIAAGNVPIAAIVFLARAERLAMRPIGQAAALGALIRQSPWVIVTDTHAPRHLEALRQAATLPAYRLEHTPDELHTIAQLLLDTVA